MKHEDYQEMLAPAALDALEENERRTFEAHLAECDDCRAELGELRDAAASLIYSIAPAAAPAPELRARVLAGIKAQTPDTPAPENGASTSSNVVSFDAEARRRSARDFVISRRALTFGSLAASLAIAALSLSLATLWQRNHRMHAEIASLSSTVNHTQQELARVREDRELLAAPEAHTATLNGTEKAGSARARLTYDKRTGRAILVTSDLPPAPAGKAYQLWFIAEGRPPLPGSLFKPDAQGHAEMHELIPAAGLHASVFAVTLEPAGGVNAPTGAMYLKGSAS